MTYYYYSCPLTAGSNWCRSQEAAERRRIAEDALQKAREHVAASDESLREQLGQDHRRELEEVTAFLLCLEH